MRTSNPTLKSNIFTESRSYGVGEPMTIQGTVNKSYILLAILVVTASWVWSMAFNAAPVYDPVTDQTVKSIPSAVSKLLMLGVFGGIGTGYLTIAKGQWAGITAPIYAALEGLFIGGISAIFEAQYPGIVLQAVSLTFGTLFCLLTVYRLGFVQVTNNFRLGVVAATGGVCLIYLISWIMGFFGRGIPMISDNGPMGIGFSLIVCGIAALNLVLDFDFIEQGAKAGAAKYMEWYGAFSLMVTLVWLYLEILRLLSKLNSRR